MAFSLDRFYQVNRRALIWLILLGLLWLLRDFFALVFMTFVVAFTALSSVRLLQKHLKAPYTLSLIGVYLALLLLLTIFVSLVVPNVVRETNRFAGNIGEIQQTLIAVKSRFFEQYPGWRRPFVAYLRSIVDEQSLQLINGQLEVEARRSGISDLQLKRLSERPLNGQDQEPNNPLLQAQIQHYQAQEEELLLDSVFSEQRARFAEYIPRFINLLYRTTVTVLLSLLFSFLVLVDIRRLSRMLRNLQASRLKDFYDEAAQPILRFANIVGRAIQVQAAIALVNTALTGIGLMTLGIPSVLTLCLMVFACSFIPVAGVFISTTPIVLVALNNGGISLSLAVILLITFVHLVEGYVLNPWIYGQHLSLNPVLVLIILFVGYHSFGVWGMVLGLPVTLYFLNDVFGVQKDAIPPPPAST
ncbi:MAG: AI-2E family transporter [Gammaproteobacteria bacterium]|nr:AI-2E family transporter [Gammaproteobacteria bacterium]